MKTIVLLITLLGVAPAFSQTSLGLNDISILVPLPQTPEQMNYLLNPVSQISTATKNELLPTEVFKFLPVLTPAIMQDSMYENNLKVVGIRFDPCFAEGFTPTGCQSQIRLVWQPIYFRTNNSNGTNKVNTIDAAIHTFYNLNRTQFNQVFAELTAISNTDKKAALQIHPTILAEGFEGAYWKQLKNLVLKYSGKKNLVRATAMTVRMDRVWGFQGVDFIASENKWTQIEIPTLKVPNKPDARVVNQSFFLEPDSLLNLTEFKGGVSLMEVSNKAWFRLLSDSQKYAKTESEDEILGAIKHAYDLENPKKHNPGTIDCVSCHIAQTVRLWGDKNFKNWDFNTLVKAEKYTNVSQNLSNTSLNPQNTNRMRAFGYFDDEPLISQRIINETAEILRQ